MSFTVLRLDDDLYCIDFEEEDGALFILLNFLEYDICYDEPGSVSLPLKEWALDEKEGMSLTTKWSLMEKKHGNVVISDLFPDEAATDPVVCEIKIQNFIDVLDKWTSVRKKKSPRIILVNKGNGNISLEDVL